MPHRITRQQYNYTKTVAHTQSQYTIKYNTIHPAPAKHTKYKLTFSPTPTINVFIEGALSYRFLLLFLLQTLWIAMIIHRQETKIYSYFVDRTRSFDLTTIIDLTKMAATYRWILSWGRVWNHLVREGLKATLQSWRSTFLHASWWEPPHCEHTSRHIHIHTHAHTHRHTHTHTHTHAHTHTCVQTNTHTHTCPAHTPASKQLKMSCLSQLLITLVATYIRETLSMKTCT